VRDKPIRLGGPISISELVDASTGSMDRARAQYGLPPKPRPDLDEGEVEAEPEPVKVEVKPEPTQAEPVPSWFSNDPVELQVTVNRQAAEAGISGTDPEIQALANSRRWPDEQSYWRAVGSLIARRRGRQESKDAKSESIGAGAAVTEASVVPHVMDSDDLIKELTEIQDGLRGSPTSPENKRARAKLRSQIAQARDA